MASFRRSFGLFCKTVIIRRLQRQNFIALMYGKNCLTVWPKAGVSRDFSASRTPCNFGRKLQGVLLITDCASAEAGASGLLTDVGEDAAIHVEYMAVDKVGGVAGKEHSRTHQVFGRSPAAGRRLAHNELVERMAAAVGLTLAQRSRLGRGDVAGTDAVALDVGLAKLRADVAREHLQSAFCSGIG